MLNDLVEMVVRRENTESNYSFFEKNEIFLGFICDND